MIFKKIFSKIRYKHVLLLIIISIAALIRFYRLPEMAAFDFDQESGANIAYSIIREHHITLIGQELTVRGIYMGPWYYYLLTPFYLLFNLDPVGGFVASVIFGLVIITTYYFIAEKLFGTMAGFLAAFIRTITFEQIVHDWSVIPSYGCELLILFTWYLFYKIWTYKSQKYIPYLFFIFGLYPSMYPVLFPLYFAFPIILLLKKIKPTPKTILSSIASFLIPFSPTLIFEIKHGFSEVRRFLFLGESNFQERNLGRFLYHIKYNLLEISRIISINELPNYLVIAGVLIISIVLIIKKYKFWKNDFHSKIILITYLLFIISFSIIPAHVSENYFIALTTLAFLYLSGLLSLLNKKYLKLLLILIIVNLTVSNSKLIKTYWQKNSQTNYYQKEMIVREIIRRSNGKNFYVSYIYTPGWQLGFNYIFKLYGVNPEVGPAKPPVYTIVIPKELAKDSIRVSYGDVGLILPDKNGY